MPSRRTSFLKRRMADSPPRSSTFTSRGRCRLPLSDLELHLPSSLPVSETMIPFSQGVIFTEHDPGPYKRKSHGTVVLAAFSGNVDEAVRTEKRPSITAPV